MLWKVEYSRRWRSWCTLLPAVWRGHASLKMCQCFKLFAQMCHPGIVPTNVPVQIGLTLCIEYLSPLDLHMFGLHIFDLHIFAMLSNICKTCFGHRLELLLILGRHVLYTRSRRLWYGGWQQQTQWKTPYRANLQRRRCVASQVPHSRRGTFSWGPCGCAEVVGDWVSLAN